MKRVEFGKVKKIFHFIARQSILVSGVRKNYHKLCEYESEKERVDGC